MNKPIFSLLAVSMIFSGCATASLSSGPDVYVLDQYPSAAKVGVAKVVDERESLYVGTIGAARIRVKKDVADMATNYLIHTLNQEMRLNVVRVEIPASENIATVAKQQGLDSILVPRIKTVKMVSIDALLEPVSTKIDMEFVVYGAEGAEKFRRFYAGNFEKRIGITIVEKSTGKLVESAVQNLMESVAGDRGLLDELQSAS